jgi:2-polyprenyl-3-methyl-5-hydroxy-6-metoxy-1,4-benzoquinol methylase
LEKFPISQGTVFDRKPASLSLQDPQCSGNIVGGLAFLTHFFSVNELTAVDQWDSAWAGDLRLRLPSALNISIRDQQRLLAKHVRPGATYLEIGCAPGKVLAWVAAVLRADVSGLDYSERGLSTAKRLFAALHLDGDLRCQSLDETTFPRASFDVVYSAGLIEHFKDPRAVVRAHVEFLKPGGTALMTVPNYRGIYGRLQRYFDAHSLTTHNLEIMTCDALRALAPVDESLEVRTYPLGRMSPWVLSPAKRWPRSVALGVSYLVNAAALLQVFDVSLLCPMLVLEIRRRKLS